MFSAILSRMYPRKTTSEDGSSQFSKFFREASSAEKKKVFLEVARKASKEQRETMRKFHVAH